MRFKYLGVAPALLGFCLWGADLPQMRRPVVGYAAQQSPLELRPILGVPGAAFFGDALPLPKRTSGLRLAPRQHYAIIERGEMSLAALVLNGTEPGQIITIPGALHVLDAVAFSPSGRSAVLFSAGSGRLQVVTGLPDMPQIVQDFDLSSLPDPPTTLAVSDDAASFLISSLTGVYRLAPDGSARTLISVTNGASMTFLPNSETAAVADQATGFIYLLQPAVSGFISTLHSSGLTTIGDIAASGDGELLYIADPDGQHIQSINTRNTEIRTFDLPVRPVRIDRLTNEDTFLIASDPAKPTWIFFRAGDDVRTVFVPAAVRNGFARW